MAVLGFSMIGWIDRKNAPVFDFLCTILEQ